jgi:CheY-like chemotaxis protein
MNILIADDDAFLQKSLSFHLMQAGHHLSVAANGQKALEMLEKNRNIDVIVCDVNMPVLTGPSLILTLKRLFPGRMPKVIVVSGLKEGADFLKKIEIKYDHFFEKPLNYDEFNKVIAAIDSQHVKI